MANDILATSQITIVDLNDKVSLSSHISCTVPQMQLKSNTGVYIPDWTTSNKNPLLTAELYKIGISSSNIIGTDNDVKSVSWFYKNATESNWTAITSANTNFRLIGTAPLYKQLKIVNNIMTEQIPGLAIKCEINYQEIWMNEPSIQSVEFPFILSIQGQQGQQGPQGQPGADAYSVVLTNENQSIACDSNGNPLSGELGTTGKAVCEIIAYRGGTKLTSALAENATLTNMNQFKYSIGANNAAYTTERFSGTEGNSKFAIKTALVDSGSIPITISFLNEFGQVITVRKEMTFVKSKKAIDAKSLDITGENIFKQTGNTITPSSITLTATVQNISGTIQWQTMVESTWTNLNQGTTANITTSTAGWSNNILKVKAYIVGTNIHDIMTIIKVSDGTNGIDAVNLSVWAPNGNIINNNNKTSIELQALMYSGTTDISTSADTSFKWVATNPNGSESVLQAAKTGANGGWKCIVTADSIPTMLAVRCEATYANKTYKNHIVLEDKIDPIQAVVISTGGDTFKNGTGETYIYAKLIRNGEEIDPITLYDNIPGTTGHKANDIIYIKSSKSYKKLVNNAWVNASASDLQFAYSWTKFNQNGVHDTSYSATGKVIHVTSGNVVEKANFVLAVSDK